VKFNTTRALRRSRGELRDADLGHGSNGWDDGQDLRHDTQRDANKRDHFKVSKVRSRSVTLTLKKNLVANGVVSVGDTFTAREARVPVKIQRRVAGSWKNGVVRETHCEQVLLGAPRSVVTPAAAPGEGGRFAQIGRGRLWF
jgi:hypothetical protein